MTSSLLPSEPNQQSTRYDPSSVNTDAVASLLSLVKLGSESDTYRQPADRTALTIAGLCCEGLSASFVLLIQHSDLNLIQHAESQSVADRSDRWVRALRRQVIAESHSQHASPPYRAILAESHGPDDDVQMLIVSLTDPDGISNTTRTGYLCFLREAGRPSFTDADCDIAELFGVETGRQLARFNDRATGFKNEQAFAGLLSQQLQERDASSKAATLLYINADSLQRIQGVLGDAAFEDALGHLSLLIRKRLRQRDLAGRIRHAQFAVYLPGCDVSNASKLSESFLDVLTAFRYERAGQVFSISVTLAVVPITDECNDVDVLMSYAEANASTRCNPGDYMVCEPDTLPSLLHGDSVNWTQRITQAIDSESIQLYAQAVVATQDTSLVDHHEILLRLSGQGDVLVSSLVFVNAAVRFGFIAQVDQYIVRHTFAYVSALYERQPSTQAVFSINISGQTMTQEFVAFVEAEFASAHFPANAIVFEIAEVDALSSLTTVVPVMRQLKASGFRFALDSFGQGMGAFLQLEKLDIDYVKIDGSLIRTMHREPLTSELVRTVQTISSALNVHCVAKQVNSDEVLQSVLGAGIRLLQGHHIQRPIRLNKVG